MDAASARERPARPTYVLSSFQGRGQVRRVDGSRPMESIFAELKTTVEVVA